ncbi:hypothetical protein JCM10908_001372 [Rhodotorula pacifica]|uniref:uncharacterized protein n=1 Tax=Rhodotorula pacifica TaxID=1495444 RepID=UPI0031770471
MSPSPPSRTSQSAVFADSYSLESKIQPFASSQSPFDELLSPRQAPTPEMVPSPSSSRMHNLTPSGSGSAKSSVISTRIDIDEDDAVSSGARIAGASSQNRADSKLVARTPRIVDNGFASGSAAASGPRRGSNAAGHLRRRSSTGNLHQTSLLMDDVDFARTAKTTPSSTGMERAPSLTTFMSGGLGAVRASQVNDRAKAKRLEREGRSLRPGLPIPRRKLYSKLLRLLSIVGFSLGVCVLVSKLLFPDRPPLDDFERDSSKSAWLARLRDQSLIFDSLETVPYPVKTHPRTPTRSEQSSLSLADYLQTRLGSHFAFPSKNLDDSVRGSQLWLTTATVDSVELSGQHLQTFLQELDANNNQPPPDAVTLAGSDDANSTTTRPLENLGQWNARRALITLCRDNGCMDYCRQNPRMFCFGGFVPHRNPKDPLDKAGLNAQNADEIAKLRAILETLETGRRVFWVDPGTYLRRDPVPYMGDLNTYDLQIPDSWSTGQTNTGIAVYNPSQRVISLFQKMVEIARLPLARDRNTWASTNLLLDPSGIYRNYEMVAPRHADALDENLFDESPNAGGSIGYGQIEFEASWDGGLDVRVLDRRHFRSSAGKLERKQFDYDQQHAGDLLYFHCVCCGDPYTNDYIAGALGYHQPAVSYGVTNPRAMPKVPLVLKAVELKGSVTELRQAMAILLQLAAETGRTFVPPLTATIVEAGGKERQMYIWRVFPVALWAHPIMARIARLPDRVKLPPTGRIQVRESSFVIHAAEYLRATLPDATEANRLATELTETLTLDLGDGELTSLSVLVERMKRPFWSTERIVALENFAAVRGKDTWKVKAEYADVSMCNLDTKPASEGGKTCEQLCPL